MSGDPQVDDKLFENALSQVLDRSKHDLSAIVGGMNVASGVDLPLVSPIDETIIFGTLQEPEKGTATMAAEAAAKAFESWSKTSMEERARILNFVVNAMGTRRYPLAAEIVLSTGMTRAEALAEVDNFVAILKKAAEDAATIKGKPKGVWGIIALTSSPLAAPMGYAAAALAAGSTVVIMPSGNCPQPVFAVYELFQKAGIPDGVINIVSDRLDRYVTELSDDLNVAGIVASGCGKGMDDLMFLMVDEGLEFINEIKGMNPIVIAHPSDIKKAASDVIESAFRYCGQRLYSTSKVIILAEDEREFTRALIERVKDLNVNDPWEPDTFCGPIISDEAEKRFEKVLSDEAAYLLHGGKRIRKEFTANGRYFSPAIFASIPPEDDTLYVDQALPMLVISTVPDIDSIIDELDQTDKGLAVGIMSREQSTINRIKEAVGEDLQVFVNKSSAGLKPALKAEMKNFLK